MALQEFIVVMRDHGRATAGGADDVFVLAKQFEKPKCERFRFLQTARVGHWLTATGLPRRKFDLAAKTFQQLQRSNADIGIELVNVTGNEETNFGHVR